MDTQNTHITAAAIRERARLAGAEITRLRPDMLVLMDDNAVEHVLPPPVGTGLPILFGGTNVPVEFCNRTAGFMKNRERPGKNVTGVTEEHELIQNPRLIKSLVPTAETAVIIYSRATPFIGRMGEVNEACIAAHRDSLPIRFVGAETVSTLSEYQSLIRKYDHDPSVDIIYTFAPVSLVRDDGTAGPATETTRWMAAKFRKNPASPG
ncbi:MAG: hypothetical protein JW781_05405 [Deltaproteobacteria bacterium]|nr:hypothetical protein [Candidatus Anaeroferrophillacea bacterium]